MSVLTGFQKVIRHIKTTDGYKKLSQWTSSNSVEFDDGYTAQTKLGAINGITDSTTADNSNIALSAKGGLTLQQGVNTAYNTAVNVDTKHSTVTDVVIAEGQSSVTDIVNRLKLKSKIVTGSLSFTFSGTTLKNQTVMFIDASATPTSYTPLLLGINTKTGATYLFMLQYDSTQNVGILRGASVDANGEQYFTSGQQVRIIGSWVVS